MTIGTKVFIMLVIITSAICLGATKYQPDVSPAIIKDIVLMIFGITLLL